MSVSFNFINSPKRIKKALVIKKWLAAVIASEKKIPGNITYVFCDDEYLLALNKRYLDHDTLTDIITFDYGAGKNVNGDIFISIERVKENASAYHVSFDNELHRVMVHGVL